MRQSRRQRPRRRPIAQRNGASSPSFALLATIGLVIILIGFALSSRSMAGASPATGTPTGAGQAHQPWCDAPGLPACPQADPGWIPIAADTPDAAAAAIQNSRMFAAVETRQGHLTLDVPALVHIIHPTPTASDYWALDHWVVSVRNDTGAETGVFDFVYDRANHRIRFAVYGDLPPSDPRHGHIFPYISADQAVQTLRTTLGKAPLSGAAPQLVFFPVDAAYLGPAGRGLGHARWTAGGEYPTDPVWFITGADGHTYFVGKDSHAHHEAEIPFAA